MLTKWKQAAEVVINYNFLVQKFIEIVIMKKQTPATWEGDYGRS